MESQEVNSNGSCHATVSNGNGLEKEESENGSVQVSVDEKEKGEIADVVLEGLDEYLDDIDDTLVISRMVSDSVIKGIVTAVEEDAAEKIAAKELEMANLKEYMQFREVGQAKYDVRLPMVGKGYEKMREDFFGLRKLIEDQFMKARKEIGPARGLSSMKKISSGSELVGLGAILQEKSLMHIDKMLECLNTNLNAFCSKMDDLLLSSEISICESQRDLDTLAELEEIVMRSVIKSLQEENVLGLNYQIHDIQTSNWVGKFEDISGIGAQLNEIHKSLCIHEMGLVSQGSHDLDHLKLGNGTEDACSIHVSEIFDFQQLNHLSKEKLVGYFNDIITKMKRDHESVLHKKTDDYFRLRRDYLKEKGSHRKDEEFDVLRKKIPEIISKLEDFVSENERFPVLTKNLESIEKLKLRLDSLVVENRQLRDSLNEKENEVKHLEARVSCAAEALLQRSLDEEKLKSDMDDSFIETSLTEEVYNSVLREQIAQARCDSEDLNMELLMTNEICDIIFSEASAVPAETLNRYEIEDSDIQSWIMQSLNGLIFKETVDNLYKQALIDNETRICLEATVLEKENELRLGVEEKKKLNQDIHDLRTSLELKEKLAIDLSFSLSQEREQIELAYRELSSVREYASQQQTLVAESNRDLESLKSSHLDALEQIEVNEMEMAKLKQKLNQRKKVLMDISEERNTALTLAQETHDKLVLSEAREENLKKEMELAASELLKLFDDFEYRISGLIRKNSLRFEDTSSHVKDLNEMANNLRRRELMYKQKLNLKSVNLLKAEAEVDVLGDEVDALLRLLNKIYIALDHYSPVLKHYPGIIEILELVKKELSGASTMLL
ncbi:hypothetical protein CASFOL_025344 [Castilleja foliolosa]|uniref:WPP domain-associated protein n=1 Tax=Castilleja foliolosa TaxID=1961234 RepID=A0ABD3CQV9_9LAMI